MSLGLMTFGLMPLSAIPFGFIAEGIGTDNSLLISGVTLVCGENTCGIDPQLERDANGKVISAPDMDRRIEVYRHYYQGYGEILVHPRPDALINASIRYGLWNW